MGLGREGAAERNRTAKEKQSKVQKINPRSEPGEAKKIEKSLQKMPKITFKSNENHSKKGLGRLREARKWARVAKKRSKSDFGRFFNDFWTARGALGDGLGVPKRAQERPSGAQEAPKSVPRALWKASCMKI